MGIRYLVLCFWLIALRVEANKYRDGYFRGKFEAGGVLVTDCTTKPSILLSKVGRPNVMAKNTVCYDSLVQLNLKNYVKGSAFQWQRNGGDIANATDSILIIRQNQAGTYSCLIRSPLCPDAVVSEPVTVTFFPKLIVSITAGSLTGVPCQEATVKLTGSVSGMSVTNYQWLFENQPIKSATSNFFDALETGVYTLKVTDMNGCAGLSGALTVITNTPPKADLSASRGGFCKGEKVTLKATAGRTYLYQWLRNGQPISGARDSIWVTQAGSYSVKITAPNACTTESAQVSVVEYDAPIVSISATGNQLCPGATIELAANGKDLRAFEWRRDGQKITGANGRVFSASQAGSYTVVVRDTNRCTAPSEAFRLEIVPKITVTLAPIRDFCGTTSEAVPLKGTPSGGVYSGTGVVGTTFDPQLAGLGQHTVTYTVKGDLDCMSGEASRTVVVSPPPTLDLGPDRQLIKGASLSLNADVGAGYTYQWTPSLGISDDTSPQPTFNPERTVTYRVVATGPSECIAKDSITIHVFAKIYIPDAFTPNADMHNDTWELKGLEEYPEVEVTVFNRWGEAVFFGKGTSQSAFNGTNNGVSLPSGTYSYTIRTEPKGHVYRGVLLLMR